MEKQYLDYEGFEHTIERLRRKEMPEPGLDYVGQIVQYVGSTTSDYVKGYYYECVSDGETPATYSWVQRDIQPKGNVTFVTPEQFGAVGDGTTDDTDAFTAAFAACPNVKCDGLKTYKIAGIIINDNSASDLDLCGATLLNFHIKVRIAADGYKSSDPYSSNFFKMHDGHLGKFTELPSDWQTPAIQCGSQLWLENLVFVNTPYIVALTNNYRDRMVFKNLLMINDSSLWTGITWELDAINLITGNGTFARINAYDVSNVATDTNGFAGDGWVIDNIDEFRSNLQPDYFFIHTYNQHTLNINRCIQTRIAIGTNTNVEFSNCHFENVNAMPVVETLTDSSTPAASALYQVDFDNCWFTDRYVLEADKPNVSYTNCYFRCCSNAHDPTIPFATIMGECDFYNVNCKIIDCVFDVDKCVINSEKWKSYKAQPKRTRNSNNNTANEGTLANSIEAIKDIASGNYKYPATGTYNYVGYAFNNSTCNDDSNSSRIAHEKYEWTRTVSSVDSDMDGSTAILNTVGGWGFEIYRTLPDGTIQRARFYDSPIEDGPKNVTQKKFHIREYGNYLVINKTVSFGSTYTETGYRLPWTTVTSIPNYTVNAQVYEKNGVLVTLDGSTIPGLANKSYAQVSDNYSITRYSIMPSTEELRALPNNTYFYTKGYYTPTDGHGGFYSKNNLFIPGSYEIPKINDGDPRVFITCLDNPVGHVNLCKYGLREAPSKNMEFSKFTDIFEGKITTLPEPSASLVDHVYEYVGESVDPSPKKNYFYRCVGIESQGVTTYSWEEYNFYTTPENTYATTNSAVLGNIYYVKMGTVFTIDEGKYFFENPIDLTPRTCGLKGASAPNAFVQNQIQRGDFSSGTILYFPFLTNGQTAIKTFKSSISDLTIYGNPNTYNLDITRGTLNQSGEMIEEPNVTENIAVVDDNEVRCTGLNPKSGIVENVYIANFYNGVDVPTSNAYLHNIFTWRCRNGVTVGNDVKCMGIYGWYNYILLTCTGAISSAVQVRGDSLVHLLNIQNGNGITVSDADGDWCAKELVILGKESGAYSQIIGIRLNDLHGRSCGLNYYDSDVLPNGRDVRDLSNIDGHGMIRVLPNTVVKDSHISIDYVGGSLIDGAARYKCTNIAFTQNTTGVLQGIYFTIPSLQTKEDILRIIQTKTGFIARLDSAYSTFFIEDGNVVEVTTDTNDMYKVYSGNYDSVEGEFYDADGNALPKVDKQQYYDITTRTTWIYYSAWSGFFRLFNDVVGMESSQMLSPLMTQYYPELNTARFRCMNVSGNDGGLIEGFIYKLDRVSVTPETGDSPADEGWWEVDSTTGKMIQTTDTEVVSGKLYFDYVWTQVKTQQSVFPGTLDEWNALTASEKAKYDFIATPDEAKGPDLPVVDITSQITMANDSDGNPIFNSGSGSPKWDIFSCVKYGRMVIFSVCFGTFTGKITSGYACFTGLPKAIIPAETGGSFDTRWFINQNDTSIKVYFSRPSSELENTATRFQLVYFTED